MALKVFSTFSGIGAFEKGLDKIGQPYELYGYCEIDKYASEAYALIHNTEEWMNYGDITKIDGTKIEKDLDLFTYGFPCQDISLAGNQKGLVNDEGNKTRSGLVWDATRIIKASQPKIAIAENVKNLVSKKFKNEFEAILAELEEAGYNNYWKVLNAKEHGIAQNRERVFIVSIRKDIDLGLFEWPEKEELKTRLLDYLEDEVDEKYFLSDKQIKRISESTYNQNRSRIHNPNGIVSTLCARDYKDPKAVDLTDYSDKSVEKIKKNIVDVNGVANTITANPQRATIDSATLIQVGQMYGTEKEPNPQAGRIYDPTGLSPTLDSMRGGNRMPKIIMPEKTKKGYALAEEGDGVYLNRPHQKRGVVQKGIIQTIKTNGADVGVVVKDTRNLKEQLADEIIESGIAKGGEVINHSYAVNRMTSGRRTIESDDGIMPTITTRPDTLGVVVDQPPLRIRKLTPKECFRLMGFDDEDHDVVEQAGISNSQRYKMAGNSIVVNVVAKILKNLIETVL